MLLTDNPKELSSIIDEQRHVIHSNNFTIKTLMIEIERLQDDITLLESENSELKTKQDVIISHLENSLKNVQELKEIMNFKKIGVEKHE
jgi:predicted RNase H-like nuclease (RuvC/YqgF family)